MSGFKSRQFVVIVLVFILSSLILVGNDASAAVFGGLRKNNSQPYVYYIGTSHDENLLGQAFYKDSSGNGVSADGYWDHVILYMYDNSMRANSNNSDSRVKYNAAHEVGHSIKMDHVPIVANQKSRRHPAPSIQYPHALDMRSGFRRTQLMNLAVDRPELLIIAVVDLVIVVLDIRNMGTHRRDVVGILQRLEHLLQLSDLPLRRLDLEFIGGIALILHDGFALHRDIVRPLVSFHLQLTPLRINKRLQDRGRYSTPL